MGGITRFSVYPVDISIENIISGEIKTDAKQYLTKIRGHYKMDKRESEELDCF